MEDAPHGSPEDPPRLVATDIDGTLLRDDRTLSPYTARVLERISAQGTPVVLVTGRPIRWLRLVYDQLTAPLPPAICANGAVVYDPAADEVLWADPLAPELLAEVARRLRAAVPGVSLAVEIVDSRQMRHEAHYPLRWDADHDAIRAVESPDELHAAPAVKLLARAGEQDPDVFVRVIAAALEGLAEATHSSYSGLVEISAAGVTKAAGLASVPGTGSTPTARLHDMPNDVPMLTWAGRAVAGPTRTTFWRSPTTDLSNPGGLRGRLPGGPLPERAGAGAGCLEVLAVASPPALARHPACRESSRRAGEAPAGRRCALHPCSHLLRHECRLMPWKRPSSQPTSQIGHPQLLLGWRPP
jgi:HAD superfamily hydrolase (TIGR01484 family)